MIVLRKYCVHPGSIMSKQDKDIHYISARRLIELYGVKLNDCFILSGNPEVANYQNIKMKNTGDWYAYIHLYPLLNGNYKQALKKLEKNAKAQADTKKEGE